MVVLRCAATSLHPERANTELPKINNGHAKSLRVNIYIYVHKIIHSLYYISVFLRADFLRCMKPSDLSLRVIHFIRYPCSAERCQQTRHVATQASTGIKLILNLESHHKGISHSLGKKAGPRGVSNQLIHSFLYGGAPRYLYTRTGNCTSA